MGIQFSNRTGSRVSVLFIMLAILAIGFSADSCTSGALTDPDAHGRLHFKFSETSLPVLRSLAEEVDTNNFILQVRDSYGKTVYDGTYGQAPESLTLPEGAYMVKASSCNFIRPAFASPQYGDEKCVAVKKGEDVQVVLECSQLNSGILLHVDRNFLTAFPSGALVLQSAEGTLLYGYREKRIAYFHPGPVKLMLTQQGKDKILMSRELKARTVLEINVTASGPSPASGGIRLQVDTARVWKSEELHLDGNGDGGEEDSDAELENSSAHGASPLTAFTVADAIRNPGLPDVWVRGYIVAGDLTASNASYQTPFKSKANLLLAPRAGKCSREACLAVSLPAGELRDALNLVEHPYNLGKSVYIKGDLVESYFKLRGLKNCSAFRLQ